MFRMIEKNDFGLSPHRDRSILNVQARSRNQHIVSEFSSHQSLKASKSLGPNGETHRQEGEGRKHILTQPPMAAFLRKGRVA